VDPGEFCGLDVGMETIGFPKVLEFLELLVVPHDVRVGVASWGGVCRMGAEPRRLGLVEVPERGP
jgi:hypothetical protein